MPAIDPTLFSAAQRGDRDAFAEVVRLHFRVAWAVALAIVQEEADAEDVVQDAFVRCWQRLGQCEHASAFGGWLRAIVRSVALNHLERERVRATVPLASISATAQPATRTTPERDLERSLLRMQLRTAMRGLTELQREVLLLYDLEGFRHAEIAAFSGISEAMSRRHLSNARQRMRAALDAQDPKRQSQ